ncbi:hypothetical protein FH608_043505 [Nonomuraea phyllanthi]|uniref:DUF4304 domain-containing protein n=1 Tax=Nonomuraea phyllanthi TaxID=2219224 RepID=A0A5C4VDR1_9ACTN|nr:hypothetical protein [Nonomuraea phyllanthi]KAB8188625.1 hypothetical protein FH608_043505 [Nonomuraea phyllanthi]
MEDAVTAGSLQKAVLAGCKERLTGLGFKKRSGPIYTKELGEDVNGWLGIGFSTGYYADALGITPTVGIRHGRVEKLLAAFTESSEHDAKQLQATFAEPLGYLMPAAEIVVWRCTAEELFTVLDDMVAAISTYGIPYMESCVDPTAMANCITNSTMPELEKAKRSAIVHLLRGDAGSLARALYPLEAEVREGGNMQIHAARFLGNVRAYRSADSR